MVQNEVRIHISRWLLSHSNSGIADNWTAPQAAASLLFRLNHMGFNRSSCRASMPPLKRGASVYLRVQQVSSLGRTKCSCVSVLECNQKFCIWARRHRQNAQPDLQHSAVAGGSPRRRGRRSCLRPRQQRHRRATLSPGHVIQIRPAQGKMLTSTVCLAVALVECQTKFCPTAYPQDRQTGPPCLSAQVPRTACEAL